MIFVRTFDSYLFIEKREKCIRKKLEEYTEVYIVLILVYFQVILPYIVETLLPLLASLR